MKRAGKTQAGVTIVSVDGGCAGVRNVRAGVIDATSQQYPLKMASLGVAAVVRFAKTGAKVSGYTDTGVNLISKAVSGVPSKNVAYGLATAGGRAAPRAPRPEATLLRSQPRPRPRIASTPSEPT